MCSIVRTSSHHLGDLAEWEAERNDAPLCVNTKINTKVASERQRDLSSNPHSELSTWAL